MPIPLLVDNFPVLLGSTHVAGSGVVVLASGEGANLAAAVSAIGGTISPDRPIRFALIEQSAKGVIGRSTKYANYTATSLSGDTLHGVVAVDGTTDQDFAAEDVFAVLWSAGAYESLVSAISAQGGGSGSDPYLVDHNGDPGTDATDAIEAALAAASIRAQSGIWNGLASGAYIRLGPGTYNIKRPIFPPDGVHIFGAGMNVTRIAGYDIAGATRTRFPGLVYGLRDPGDCSASRADLYGILDATAAPSSGVRRGWNTAAQNLALQGQFCSANLGHWNTTWDYYEFNQLTIDVCLVRPSAGWTPGQPILGCGDSYDVNRPRGPGTLVVSSTPGYFLWRGADDRAAGEGDLGNLGIAIPDPGTSVVRLSIQIDLSAGTAAAWTNGVRRTVIIDGFASGHSFRFNSDWPFVVGRQGYKAESGGAPPAKLTLAGLHMQKSLRYAWGSIGAAQARADSGVINDLWRYFDQSGGSNLIGFLSFQDPPSQRWLTWKTATSFDECLVVMSATQGGGKPAMLEGLSIGTDGPCVMVGAVLNWRGKDLLLKSLGTVALGTVPAIISYPVALVDCIVSGQDAAISVGQAIVQLERVNIEGQGRDGIRIRASSLSAINFFVSFAGPIAKTFLRVLPGGEGHGLVTLKDGHIDYEDEGPSVAIIEADTETQHAMVLTCERVITGLSGPTYNDPRPFAKLNYGAYGVARFKDVVGRFKTAMFTGGTGWTTDVDCPSAEIIP